MTSQKPEGLQEYTLLELATSPDGPPLMTLPFEGAHAILGRAPSNNIVLTNTRISWYHALIWTESGAAWVRDLGSTNHTFIDNKPINKPAKLEHNSVIDLALSEKIWTRCVGGDHPRRFALEDLLTGVILPFPSDHFSIGGREDVDLMIPGASPDIVMTLMLYDEELYLGVDTVTISIGLEQPFEIAGRMYRIRALPEEHAPTELVPIFHYPYRLTVQLSGTASSATLEDLRDASRQCEISSSNRAVLLYILAKKFDSERLSGNESSGWCSVEEVSSGIWGRGWRKQSTNNLNVLVHRLRKQIKDAGFDPWCIEKRHKRLRLRIQEFKSI